MPSGVADGSVHFGHAFLGELKPWHLPSTAIVAENLPLPFASTRMSKRCPGKKRAPSGGVIVTTGSPLAAPATTSAASTLRTWTLIVSPSSRVAAGVTARPPSSPPPRERPTASILDPASQGASARESPRGLRPARAPV